MKFYSVLILFLLITYINSECEGGNASSLKDCKDKKFSDEEIANEYSSCCYVEMKDGLKTCWALKKDDSNDIEGYLKKSSEGNDVKSLKCNSLFLKLGLVNILLFLL